MVAKIVDLEVIVTDSEVEALILEANLIKKLKPHYNVDLKDDKSYPYVVVTNEPFPRIFVTRRVVSDESKYFGPYTDVRSMRLSLKMIRDIFKVRSCNYNINDEAIKKRKIKVCLDYHIKKCGGPCEGLVSQEKYNMMIDEIIQILRGKTTTLVTELRSRMEQLSNDLEYEEAAILRDRISQLSVYTERQKVVDSELIDRDICVIASVGNYACGVVFNVRDGKIIGKKHLYMSGVEGETEDNVLEQFLERYYLDTEDVPQEIFISHELNNSNVIQQWLSEKRGSKVDIVIPKIGDKAKLMTMCKNNAQLLLDEYQLQKEKQKERIPHSIIALQRDLRLKKPPRRIECFDISNLQGTDTAASMVVFADGKPKKSEYRKYKLVSIEGSNDYASMKETVRRRYEHLIYEKKQLPDLILIDGGKGQLSSATQVLGQLGILTTIHSESEQIPFIPIIGIAKRLEEIFLPHISEPMILPKTSSSLKLLQHIRNEAHRFAITYHRVMRNKRLLQTELDLIEGVGKKRAKQLLEVFGSVQGVKFATYEQLLEIVGERIATQINEYFVE